MGTRYKLKRTTSTLRSLKDFDQEDIYRFVKYRGQDLYDTYSVSSLGVGQKLIDTKRGKFNPGQVSRILSKGVSIIFPANEREYTGKEFINVSKPGDKYIPEFDVILNVHDGLIEFADAPLWYCSLYILPKYWTKESSWNYRIISGSGNYPRPILTCPTREEDWIEILRALLEMAVLLKLFSGAYYKIFLSKSDTADPNEKYFSSGNSWSSLLTLIPTVMNLGYRFIWYPKIMGKLSRELSQAAKADKGVFRQEKILNYCKKKFKDIYFVNLGDGSCFINPKYVKDVDSLRQYGDSSRLRTPLDWILKGYEDGKYLILYSDLDNSLAIAHEVGHYLEDKDGTLGKIQRNNNKGIFSDDFVKWFGAIANMVAPIGFGTLSKTSMYTEIISTLTGLLLKSPELIVEFMASYKGYNLLKDIGMSDRDLEEAKKYFGTAWKTYLAGAGASATTGSSLGRVTGGLLKNSLSTPNQRTYSEDPNKKDSVDIRSKIRTLGNRLKDRAKPVVKDIKRNFENSISDSFSNLSYRGRNNYVTYDY